jgi:molecular chaperone GrpE
MNEREPSPSELTEESESQELPLEALQERCRKLEEEKRTLEKENRSLFDQLLRRQADFDNFRKRLEREQAELRPAAQASLVTEILPALDAFERALAADIPGIPEDYRKGVELIYKQLIDALASAGLETLVADGQPFDPNLHHAVERIESADHPDQQVVATLQKGYLFRQRLLRPALVRVAVHPPAGEPPLEN